MVKHRSTPTKAASLFEVRLPNLEHDVVVLKGSEHDAPSALILGKIVLLLKEPVTVKSISLRMYSTVRLSWIDMVQTASGNVINRPLRFEKKAYEHSWDNVDFSQYLSNAAELSASSSLAAGAPPLSRNSLSVSLKSLGKSMRQKSSTSLSNMNLGPLTSHSLSTSVGTSASGQSNQTLNVGNYEFPFSAVLPGDMPESLEGLPGASNVYRLEATVDRGKFHGNMVTKKHMRVVRTMTTDAVELSELVLVDNTWPKKVEYSLNVPAKAIAVGSGTPVSCMFVPLVKGLRLGKISIQLQELYSYIGYVPPIHSGERIVAERILPAPPDDDPQYGLDRWEVETFLRVPTSLLKISQDCDIQQHIKVRHKIKFNIGLINPDGHVSELRASLPVQLFISPFIAVSGKPEDHLFDTDNVKATTGEASASASTTTTDASQDCEEEPVILAVTAGASATSLLNAIAPSSDSSFASLPGLMAPPLYERHIHDRVWSDSSPTESPMISIENTPTESGHLNHSNGDGYFGYDPGREPSQGGIDAQLLGHNLSELNQQRQSPSSGLPGGYRATFSLDGANTSDGNDQAATDSGHRPSVPSHLYTPQALSPPTHLLRASSSFKLDTLTMVPSYHQAIKSGTNDELLAPAYKPPMPGSSVNLAEVNRRFEELTSPPSPQALAQTLSLTPSSGLKRNLSRGSSLSNLRGLTSTKPPSTGSSPLHSRNVSVNSLTALPLLASAGRHRGTSSRPNSGASSRNGSFMNLPNDASAPAGLSPTSILRHGSINDGASSGSTSRVSRVLNAVSSLLPGSMQGLSLLSLTKKKDTR